MAIRDPSQSSNISGHLSECGSQAMGLAAIHLFQVHAGFVGNIVITFSHSVFNDETHYDTKEKFTYSPSIFPLNDIIMSIRLIILLTYIFQRYLFQK